MVTVAEQHETDTVRSARGDARAQGGKIADAMPYLPASSTPYPPPGVDVTTLTWAETVAGGNYTHKVIARGTRVRLPARRARTSCCSTRWSRGSG